MAEGGSSESKTTPHGSGLSVTSQEVLEYFQTLSNWGRWGDDDERGTLNLITDEVRKQASSLIESGAAVSCGWPIGFNSATQVGQVAISQRFMLRTGEGLELPTLVHRDGELVTKSTSSSHLGQLDEFGRYEISRHNSTYEYIGMMFHGQGITHMDSHSHVSWDGVMYNNRPAELVSARSGAQAHPITVANPGVFTRGVLLDIPIVLGIEALGAGTPVTPEMLEEAEHVLGVSVGAGDALLLRTGHGVERSRTGIPQKAGNSAGYHPSCLPWLHERGVAVLCSDGPNEAQPHGLDESIVSKHTMHAVAMVAMGLWFVVFLNLEELSKECADRKRYEFAFSVAPLGLEGCTGSPVNPLAIF
jgi:kynurenine formamidase